MFFKVLPPFMRSMPLSRLIKEQVIRWEFIMYIPYAFTECVRIKLFKLADYCFPSRANRRYKHTVRFAYELDIVSIGLKFL
jgi:hypothetical protein